MAMQKLNVRFSNEVKNKLSDVSTDLCVIESDVARAALNIGLDALRDEAYKAIESRDFSRVNKLVSINQRSGRGETVKKGDSHLQEDLLK